MGTGQRELGLATLQRRHPLLPAIVDRAAAICGCAVATIKSRVNRAPTRLADRLSIDSVDDFGPDRATRAVLAGGGRN